MDGAFFADFDAANAGRALGPTPQLMTTELPATFEGLTSAFPIILFSYAPPANTLKGRNPHLRRAGTGFRISGGEQTYPLNVALGLQNDERRMK